LPFFRSKIAALTASELSGELERLGIPFSPIAQPIEMFDDPHVNRPGGLVASRMADGRIFRAPGMPFEKDGEAVSGPSDVPGLGMDTEAVLREAGCPEELIATIIGQGGEAE
jgi:crotonobetainyl-CoA:carnitine CoA-transferase CaiB-like acyl-CoA transferase